MHKPSCSFHVVWILLYAILGRPPTEDVDHAVDYKYKRNASKTLSNQQWLRRVIFVVCARVLVPRACHLQGQQRSYHKKRCCVCYHTVRECVYACVRVWIMYDTFHSALLHTRCDPIAKRQICAQLITVVVCTIHATNIHSHHQDTLACHVRPVTHKHKHTPLPPREKTLTGPIGA